MKTAASVIAAVITLIACGTERPPPTGGSYTSNGGAAGGGGFADAGPTKLPGCGDQGNGKFCDCVDTPLFAEPPNIYFVLDRSGSMAEDNKWDQVRVVVAQILRGLGPRARFGATVFPGFEQSSCALAKEILPLTLGDPPTGGRRSDHALAPLDDGRRALRRNADRAGAARRPADAAQRAGQDVRHPRDRRRPQLQHRRVMRLRPVHAEHREPDGLPFGRAVQLLRAS